VTALFEEELAELLSEPGFINAIYENNAKTVEACLNSLLVRPYNLTVYDRNGSSVLAS